MAFHDGGLASARALLIRDFGSALQVAATVPSVSRATKAPVIGYVSPYQAEVRGANGIEYVNSSRPFAHSVAGRERPVDLRLEARAAGFAPVNAPDSLVIARSLSAGAALPGGVHVSMEGRNVPGTPLANSAVFFGGVAEDVDATVSPTDGGVEFFATLRSRLSPEELRYRFALPAGAVLRSGANGIDVLSSGRVLAIIPQPTASDAQGQEVPVSTTTIGDVLVLHVSHRAGSFAYPIMVDPEIRMEKGAPGWTFEEGYYKRYTETGFTETPEGPFIPREIGGIEGPGGVNYVENEHGGRAARWVWKGPAGLVITNVSFIFSNRFSPEKEANNFYGFVGAGCGGAETYIGNGWNAFSAQGNEAACPPTNELYIQYYAPNQEPAKNTGNLYVSAIWLTETARFNSEDYGSSNEAEPNIPRVNCGKPVNCATGDEFEAHTDMGVGGNPGLGLTRTYNSQLGATQESPGPFGYGWTASYGGYITFDTLSCAIPVAPAPGSLLTSEEFFRCSKRATVHQSNGSTVVFDEGGGGAWLAKGPDVQATLTRRESSGTYEFVLPGSTKILTFEEKTGRLLSEFDPATELTTSLTYNGSGQLTKVEEPAKRSITFAYNTEGQVKEATGPQGTVLYKYTSHNLTEVTDLDKHVWKYEYDTHHQMTAETDPLSHTIKTEYNSANQVVSQTDALSRKRTWKYVTTGSGTETTVTDPTGAVNVELFNEAHLPTSITHAYGTPLAATTTFEYDAYYDLIAVTDPDKHTTKYGYDVFGDRTSEKDANGNETKRTYYSDHTLESVTTPKGETTTIKLDFHQRPEKISRPTAGGTQTTAYKYDSRGDITSVTDPLEHKWTYEYDTYGDRTAEIDPEGDKRTWSYNGASQQTSTVSPRGNVTGGEQALFTTTTERDAEGRPLAATEPLSEPVYVRKFGSSGSGGGQFSTPVGMAVDSSGNIWVADSANNRLQKFSSSGTFIETIGWGVSNGEAKYETCTSSCRAGTAGSENGEFHGPTGIAINKSTGNIYVADSANNRVEEFSSAATFVRAFGTAGSGNGNLSSPNGLTIDSTGNVWVADTANKRIEEFNSEGKYENKYGSEGTGADEFKAPDDVTISGGNVFVGDYENNRVDELSSTGSFVKAFGFGVANGESKPETCTTACQAGLAGSANGQLNGAGWLASDPTSGNLYVADHGNSRIQEFNTSGTFLGKFGSSGKGEQQFENLKAVIAGAAGAVYAADAGNERIQQWTGPTPRVTKYTYDAAGNLETQTDPNGNKTKYTHDADNELTKTEAPNKAIGETEYDKDGQIISQTDGNKHITKYIRNTLEQITEIIDPLTHKTTKEYDPAGNLKTLTDPERRITTYTYDPGNRLTEIKYSDGKTPTVKYEYDRDGDRTVVIDGTGTSSYTYDELDRLTEAKDGHGDTTKYEYDLVNQQTKITYPNGKAIVRGYNIAGRLEKITDWLEHTTTFSYDPDGDLTATTFPTETTNEDKYAYNDSDKTSEIAMLKGTETIASLTYTRDFDGEVKTTTSKGLPGSETTETTYDANDRLTKAGSTVYEYDAANNPTKIAGGTYKYNAASQLESSTGATYGYDELGERTKTTPTTGQATTYGYDQAGNLISVARPKEGETPAINDTYAYSEGLRTSQTISSTTSYLTWDHAESIPLILNDGANSYIYGPGGLPVEQITSAGTVTYLHHDQQGSTRLLTGTTGTVTGTFTYDSYGNLTGHTGTSTTPLGYDGQYTSADTGLIYLRARVYDPATAQFLSVDPMLPVTGAPYTYAGDNPLTYGDPRGLSFGGFLEEVGEGIAGWGDTLTFGATNWAREELGINNINACSTAYQAGGYAGLATGVLIPGEGEVLGAGDIAAGAIREGDVLGAAERWLGEGYREIAPGVYRSADDARQFRATPSDLGAAQPHVHFESIGPGGRGNTENAHVYLGEW
jgi:RHS repeat-associated protein